MFTRYGETFDYQIKSILNITAVPHEKQKKVVITGRILCLDCTESKVTVGFMVIMMITLLTKDTSVPVVIFVTTLVTLPPRTTITILLAIILCREAKVFWLFHLNQVPRIGITVLPDN